MCAHWNESLEGKLARRANPPGWPGRPARKKVLYTRPLKIFTLFARQYSSLPAEGWTEASGLESSELSEDYHVDAFKMKKNNLVLEFWAFCPNQNGTRMLMVVQPVRASPAGVRLASSKREEKLVGRGEERGRRVACVGDGGRRLGRASWEESGKIVACRGFLRLQRRGWEGRG